MQVACVKGKLNCHCTGRLLRSKCDFRADLIARSVKKNLTGGFIHQDTGYGVFSPGLEIFIGNFVCDLHFTERINTVTILGCRCCTDFRNKYLDRLAFGVNVLMLSNQSIRLDAVQLVKDNQLCVLFQI